VSDDQTSTASGETISEGFARYDKLTGQASGSARNLCLAGIAAVWLLAAGPGGEATKLSSAPTGFIWAAMVFAVGIALDIAHYAISGAVLVRWLRAERTAGKELSDFVNPPKAVRLTPAIFYWLKILATFAGYVVLGITIGVSYL
jgi:hypothetical protein